MVEDDPFGFHNLNIDDLILIIDSIGTVHEDRETMQSAHPRDFDALLLVVGLFAILLVVSLTIGSPAIR